MSGYGEIDLPLNLAVMAAAIFSGVGGPPRGTYPYILDPGPLGYMIVNIGQAEKASIVKASQELRKELCSFRGYSLAYAG